MKRTMPLFLLLVFAGFTGSSNKELLSTIRIGKFTYKIYKESKFVHDSRKTIDFFTVYGENKQQHCSAYMLEKANDTVIVRDKFRSTQNFLEFREYYSRPRYDSDSVIKRFYPNKKGKLILLRFIQYKNGVEHVTKY